MVSNKEDIPLIRENMTFGYVVKMDNPVNFDIDILATPKQQQKYLSGNIITNRYEYYDVPPCSKIVPSPRYESLANNTATNSQKLYSNASLKHESTIMPSLPKSNIGITYRCRIKDIGVLKPAERKNNKAHDKIYKLIYRKVKQQINLQGGWVIVELGAVDKYNRLLVNLYDPISLIDIKSIHLAEGEPVFYKFIWSPKLTMLSAH